MGKLWRKVKVALGLNLCVYPPRNYVADNDDVHQETLPPSERLSNAEVTLTSPSLRRASAPSTPVSSKLRISKSLSRSSSKKTCSICLASMRQGDGHAIFTAECSHSFHFHCITSNVKHGNQICPVCRAKWKEIPLQGPSLDAPLRRARTNSINWPNNNEFMTMIRRVPPPRSSSTRNATLLPQTPDPPVFDDDELLDHHFTDLSSLNKISLDNEVPRKLKLKTFTELPAVARSNTLDSFTVLLNLKAPCSNLSRAPVDLVTVLDISGSMTGSKLALLKRAVGFVIQNLGSNDRLSVITFSSTARRLFPLRRMSEGGRLQALLAVNGLVANGGTNIAEGLRKAVKTVEDRREKNPVASIILLSDGQDTYMVNNLRNVQPNNYELLLPLSLRSGENSGVKIPIHSFGFGADHDASSMHSVSESSGGTFSFIETEGAIQDAFAQCIGGILSVVVKDLQVSIESVDSRIFLGHFKAGSYPNRITSDQRTGYIEVGDLYADEQRDFLVSLNIPSDVLNGETSVLMVRCVYKDPLTKESVTMEGLEVRVLRTEVGPRRESVSIEVDRQQNRVRATETMADARTAAENGDLASAISLLENCRKTISESISGKSQDSLCVGLDGELKEMQERMASRHMYEASGRAFILSGLSSHTMQRATARGDSDTQSYQTRSMTEMVTRSQAESPSTQSLLRDLLRD